MAKLNKQVIGQLSGKIGDIVIRKRNGKNFASSRPASFFPGFDAASVGRRDRFGIACKFSSKVYALPYLKKIWKSNLPPGSYPYNQITKLNYGYAEPGELSDKAVIVPESGFNIKAATSALFPPCMQVVIDKIGSNPGIDPLKEPVLKICTVIYLTNPKDESSCPFDYISLVSEGEPAVPDSQTAFKLFYTGKDIELFDSYTDRKAFSALISLDADDNPVHFSRTFVIQ